MSDTPREAIIIVDYDPDWPEQYADEAARVCAALGPILCGIEPVGSTAIPGLAAKPIIDLMAAVSTLQAGEDAAPSLARLGYAYMGEYGLPGRLFYQKGEPRTHHLHLVLPGSEFWQNQILFRDYMRLHPDEAARYASLKRALSAQHRYDRAGYTQSKGPYILGVLDKARAAQNAAGC